MSLIAHRRVSAFFTLTLSGGLASICCPHEILYFILSVLKFYF